MRPVNQRASQCGAVSVSREPVRVLVLTREHASHITAGWLWPSRIVARCTTSCGFLLVFDAFSVLFMQLFYLETEQLFMSTFTFSSFRPCFSAVMVSTCWWAETEVWFPSGRSMTSNSCSRTLAAMQEYAPWPCHMTKGTHKAAQSAQYGLTELYWHISGDFEEISWSRLFLFQFSTVFYKATLFRWPAAGFELEI